MWLEEAPSARAHGLLGSLAGSRRCSLLHLPSALELNENPEPLHRRCAMLRCNIVDVVDLDGNVVANRIELRLQPPPRVAKFWHAWVDRLRAAAI